MFEPWMGQHLPDRRYLAISLSFDMRGEEEKTVGIEGRHGVHDLKTGAFSAPPDFAASNAGVLNYPAEISLTGARASARCGERRSFATLRAPPLEGRKTLA
jgi:hypothetical protein